MPRSVRHGVEPSGAKLAPMTALTIRDAELDDMPALRRVFRDASLSNDGDRPALLAHPEVLELSDAAVRERRTRVATAGDEVVGFVTVAPADEGLELEDLFVAPTWMRQGVATALVRDVVRSGHDQGVDRLVVTANLHARAFYESAGFRSVGETPTTFGPAMRMHRDLAP
jgi:ribosomal protein S18 acetylase RimI-like enzyme